MFNSFFGRYRSHRVHNYRMHLPAGGRLGVDLSPPLARRG
jgi:hypothetical protein